jgi:hypothetical protein
MNVLIRVGERMTICTHTSKESTRLRPEIEVDIPFPIITTSIPLNAHCSPQAAFTLMPLPIDITITLSKSLPPSSSLGDDDNDDYFINKKQGVVKMA